MKKTEKIKGSWVKRFFAHRQHPVIIISYIAKYLWLLLIPLGKYLIATKFDFQNWIKANWVDILTLSVIFGYAILRWIFVYFEIEEDCIVAHTGYFGVSETRVYFSEMSSLSLCQGYFFRAIGACTLYIDTDAKSLQEADIKLDLNTKQAMMIYDLATVNCINKPKYVFNSKKSNLIIFSFIFSSTLSGVLLLLSVGYEAYRIVGIELEQQVFQRVTVELERLAAFMPKYFLVAGIIIIGGWLISFVANLMRHWNFSCTRCGDCLMIVSGKGSKRKHILKRERINHIDYQQSMFMKLFRICSVSVGCTGYGKRRLEISALIPITTNSQVDASIKMLMPGIPPVKSDVRTGAADIRRFITLPLVYCIFPPIIYKLAVHFLDIPKNDFKVMVILAMLPLIWLIVVKIAAAFTTSVGFDNGYCTITYCKFYRFHKTVVDTGRISKITVTQNPLQRISKTCNLKVYTCAEKTDRHVVKGLNHKKVINLLNENGYSF